MINNILKAFHFIQRNLWILRSLPYSLFFCFHYLPIKQAVKVPILLYKPQLIKCDGFVKINSKTIRFGMICLGHNKCSLYSNTGISYENNGGTIIFQGNCMIGRNCFISVGKKAIISFGNRFECNAALKLACHYKIMFDNDVSLGFECLCTDSDFHQLSSNCNSGSKALAYGPIKIGSGSWIGTRCTILKNSILPANCVVASCSLLNKKYEVPECTLLAGTPAVAKKTGVYRNRDNDKVDYQIRERGDDEI